VFLLIAPGVVAGLVPWQLTHWQGAGRGAWAWVTIPIAAVLIVAGVGFLLQAFIRFAAEGLGTPAPVAPPQQLVVGGVYRFVRNPMYLAVEAIIYGQALLFRSGAVALYGIALLPIVWAFVHWYEEPTLARKFGAQYEEYRRAVPGWIPRLTPWKPTR
jgi:protein-S-isoprenylcysteine O-methyltransferase Ste14